MTIVQSRRRLPWVFYTFPGLGLLLGFAVFAYGYAQHRAAIATESWPETTAVVIDSAATTSHSGGRAGRGGGSTHGASIVYRYEVQGTTHTGTRVSFGDYTSSDPAHSREVLRRFPVGAAVPVYYDPADPASAVLERGTGFGNWLLYIVGAGFMFVGAVMIAVPLLAFRTSAPLADSPTIQGP